jgi:hypothetical protein
MAYKPNQTEMTATGAIPSELLTKKEVAQRLRCSDKTIEKDEDFPTIRHGGMVRYSWPEVLSYFGSKTQNKEG